MVSVREQLLRRFPPPTPDRWPDDDLAHALYFCLWSIVDRDLTVDGWSYFRVIRESEESIDAVGLMTTLHPGKDVPIEMNVKARDGGFAWSALIGGLDPAWLALSDHGRWKRVYLYATGQREIWQWTWARQYHGSVHHADA
jgi:hypothetical protein